MSADPHRLCLIELIVHGVPAPQGSKTKMPNGAMVEAGSSTGRQKLGNWRNDVRAAAEKWRAENGGPALLDGPLAVDMHFHLPRPKARKHDVWVSTKPDLSKLARSTEDALTGIIWRDDSLIVDCTLSKCYVLEGYPPGADIFIYRPASYEPPKPRKKAA